MVCWVIKHKSSLRKISSLQSYLSVTPIFLLQFKIHQKSIRELILQSISVCFKTWKEATWANGPIISYNSSCISEFQIGWDFCSSSLLSIVRRLSGLCSDTSMSRIRGLYLHLKLNIHYLKANCFSCISLTFQIYPT